MTTTLERKPTIRIAALPLSCSNCGEQFEPAATAICEECLGPLEPLYDSKRALPGREELAGRTPSIWEGIKNGCP